jgi:predicted nuclease of predicted toxin-antitoxin system
MQFLVDAQLPPALARWLSSEGGRDATHVMDYGMTAAGDRYIWDYAKMNDAIIISKDEDFANLPALYPDGPAVVWLRVGNTTRRGLLAWFADVLPKIERALAAGEKLIEVTEQNGGSGAQPI